MNCHKCTAKAGGPNSVSYFPNDRRLPRAVEDAFFAPVGADIEREMSTRCRQPVRFLFRSRGLRSRVERERPVGVALEILVLGAERVAFDVVRMEEMLVVVQGQRPEAVDRRFLSWRERELVAGATIELCA